MYLLNEFVSGIELASIAGLAAGAVSGRKASKDKVVIRGKYKS